MKAGQGQRPAGSGLESRPGKNPWQSDRPGALALAMYNRLVEQADWLSSPALACRQGCTACCTQSVAMTTLEGQIIMAYLDSQAMDPAALRNRLPGPGRAAHGPRVTTNQLARLCLAGKAEADSLVGPGGWNFSPCPFLEQGDCLIYPARPFACRALVSQQTCGQGDAALMPAVLVTLSSIWQQLIEHADAGGFYGNMFDILVFLQHKYDSSTDGGREATACLLDNQPVPGFLIPPEERQEVSGALAALFKTVVDGQPFAKALKAVRPGTSDAH